MKHLKTKLMAAIAMLLVATVMLTSASFAWFTISTAPEIKELTTQVTVNENLEIALARETALPEYKTADGSYEDSYSDPALNKDAAYSWGNLVNITESGSESATAYTALNKELSPITYSNSKFVHPTYGLDGRVNEIKGTISDGDQDGHGFGNMVDADDNIYGYYVDFWLQTNVDSAAVALSEAVDRGAGELGEGSTFTADSGLSTGTAEVIAKSIRIAFLELGTAELQDDGTYGAYTSSGKTAADVVVATNTPTNGEAVFSGTVTTLAKNTPTLIRMYVYLEGEEVTNAMASVGTTATDLGDINIQFASTSVTTAMALPAGSKGST